MSDDSFLFIAVVRQAFILAVSQIVTMAVIIQSLILFISYC